MTREKVRAAVDELDYRPNAIAKGLRTQRTNTIGFISDVIGTTPYAGRILQGAQDAAWDSGKLLVSINTGSNQGVREAAVSTLLDRRVDGIIYAAMYHREVKPPEALYRVPSVLLDCFVADHSLPSVIPNEENGAYTAVSHLFERGYRRIGFLCDVDNTPAKFGRLEGYRQALADHGVSFDETLVCEAPSIQSGGYDAALVLLQRNEPPDALFCYNDRMAMGAYDALRKSALEIPSDMAVVGFDNHELIAAHLHPPLTTMQLPHYEMGEWALNHLLSLIDNPGQRKEMLPEQHILDCPLIVRKSVQPVVRR